MLKKIATKRDSITWFLLLSFIPLEIFPFLCESDSVIWKMLLVVKFCVILTIYVLHVRDIDLKYHAMLLLTTASLSVSAVINGGFGVCLLVLTMLMAMVVFPTVSLNATKEKRFWGLMAAGLFFVFLYACLKDFASGLPLFGYGKGKAFLNGNTYGFILLGMFFYIVSMLGATSISEKKKHLLVAICTVAFVVILIWNRGRTSLLSVGVFVLCYLVYAVGQQKSRIWAYILVLGSVMLCFVVLFCLDILPGKMAGFFDEFINGRVLGKKVLSGRERLWRASLYGFVANPLWGNGSNYLLKYGHLISAHNVLIGLLVYVGIIPTLSYLWLLMRGSVLFDTWHSCERKQIIKNNGICFLACLVVTVFECSFTDNQLNFLFLPLLLNVSSILDSRKNGTQIEGSAMSGLKGKKLGILSYAWLVLVAAALLIFSIEPNILMNKTRMALSASSAESLYEDVGEGHVLLDDVPDNQVQDNVIWERKGNYVYVEGSALKGTQLYCYFDKNNLPQWIEKGKSYQAIYNSQHVQLQIITYSAEGKHKMILNTIQNAEFTVPENAMGLNVRLYIDVGTDVSEVISPLIQPVGQQDPA